MRDFSKLRGLDGLPDALLEAHVKLYDGYVANLNAIRSRLAELKAGTHEWAELERRLPFEVDGMRLHELYFSNLAPRGRGRPVLEPRLLDEFRAMGAMRGIGWVICYRDPATNALADFWIGSHEIGHPAGFQPILVMDLWEHAFTGMEKSRYVEAFFANVDWVEVERRLR